MGVLCAHGSAVRPPCSAQAWQLRTDIGALRNQVAVMEQQRSELEARAVADASVHAGLQVRESPSRRARQGRRCCAAAACAAMRAQGAHFCVGALSCVALLARAACGSC